MGLEWGEQFGNQLRDRGSFLQGGGGHASPSHESALYMVCVRFEGGSLEERMHQRRRERSRRLASIYSE